MSGYGLGWGEKKKNNGVHGLSPKIFNGKSYSRAIACCGHLTSNQNVLMYTTHIRKLIARLYFFILRSRITEKQQQVRKFAEVWNFAWHRIMPNDRFVMIRNRPRLPANWLKFAFWFTGGRCWVTSGETPPIIKTFCLYLKTSPCGAVFREHCWIFYKYSLKWRWWNLSSPVTLIRGRCCPLQ